MNAKKIFEEAKARFDLPFKARFVHNIACSENWEGFFAHAEFDGNNSLICLHTQGGLDAIIPHELGHLKAEGEGKYIEFLDTDGYEADTMFGEYWADRHASAAGYREPILKFNKRRLKPFIELLHDAKERLDMRVLDFMPVPFQYHANFAALNAVGQGTLTDLMACLPKEVARVLMPHHAAFSMHETYQDPQIFLAAYKLFIQTLHEAAPSGAGRPGQQPAVA